MVFFFVSTDGHLIYMGKDKYENEELLRWGWPEDCIVGFMWQLYIFKIYLSFHKDNLSSAHVYLRLNSGETFDNFSESALKECCQLVKQNSIEGSKKQTVTIVYTPFLNLKKSGDMDIGQVGFKNEKQIKYAHKVSKERAILKTIEKTQKEEYPDLEKMLQDRNLEEKNQKIQEQKLLKLQQKEEEAKQKEEDKIQEEQSYKNMFKGIDFKPIQNKDIDIDLEEDFI